MLNIFLLITLSLSASAQEESLSEARARNFEQQRVVASDPSEVPKMLRQMQLDSDMQTVNAMRTQLLNEKITAHRKNMLIEDNIRNGFIQRFLNNRLTDELEQIQYIKSELQKAQVKRDTAVIIGFTGLAITVSALVESYIPQRFNLGLLKKPLTGIQETLTTAYGLKTVTIVKQVAVVAAAYGSASAVKWVCVHWDDIAKLEKALDLAQRRVLADKRAADVMLADGSLNFLSEEGRVDWLLSTLKSF